MDHTVWSNFNSSFKITKYLGNLVKLVGKNFEDLVVNNENDVFIKFYAPWCGHCKAMAEDWAKLADEYADDQSMVIAEFDATANDTRKFSDRHPLSFSCFPNFRNLSQSCLNPNPL